MTFFSDESSLPRFIAVGGGVGSGWDGSANWRREDERVRKQRTRTWYFARFGENLDGEGGDVAEEAI